MTLHLIPLYFLFYQCNVQWDTCACACANLDVSVKQQKIETRILGTDAALWLHRRLHSGIQLSAQCTVNEEIEYAVLEVRTGGTVTQWFLIVMTRGFGFRFRCFSIITVFSM